jgi:cold shock CspA family protein
VIASGFGWRAQAVLTGRIVEFDVKSGCGVIVPDDGGPLVYIDVYDLGRRDLTTGTLVRFSSVQGLAGRKAYNVRIVSCPQEAVETEVRRDDAPLTLLNEKAYAEEIYDALFIAVPGISIWQVREVKQRLTLRAVGHGWISLNPP